MSLGVEGARGQGTVEYLLMLLIAMMTFFIVVRSGLGPLISKFQEDLSSRAMQTFFGGGSAGEALHQLRIGK
jgi:hypothetical protein